MAHPKLFEYAVLYHPAAKRVEGVESRDPSQLLVKPTTILARDEKEAQILAAREIPAEYMDRLDRVEIALRPF